MSPHQSPSAWELLLAELAAGSATQTVTLDGFRVTDLRAW